MHDHTRSHAFRLDGPTSPEMGKTNSTAESRPARPKPWATRSATPCTNRSASLRLALVIAGACVAFPPSHAAGEDAFTVTMRVDLGRDVGRNFGTLFEARDSQGRVVAGAGFLGTYNTQARSDRQLVHFYVKPAEEDVFRPEVLPRPTSDAGTYLFEFDGKLFSKPRGGATHKELRVWDESGHRWRIDDRTVPFSVAVGDGVLTTTSRAVTYAGRRVLALKPDSGSMAEPYYANAFLCFRRYDHKASPPINELVACRWTSDQNGQVNASDGKTVAMGTPREFVYAWGQLDGQVVAATNTGGVYAFDGRAWKTVLEPDVNVSFQIYAMLNYRDKLLMGQYPTGELFAYDGVNLKHLEGWPPVMPGVRKQAREAQTLTLYGGDIYAGVWPWGEVWRYDDSRAKWSLAGRMFTHPEPTDKTTHPYETETTKLGSVLNRWGQRVTSLVPLGDALYISTSSKGGTPWEPKFTFLGNDKWKEYGKVYRYRRHGCLAARTKWTNGPTTLEFRFTGERLVIRQDGKPLGTTGFDAKVAARMSPDKTRWGTGVFGKFRGKIEQHDVAVADRSQPFVSDPRAMLHQPNRVVPRCSLRAPSRTAAENEPCRPAQLLAKGCQSFGSNLLMRSVHPKPHEAIFDHERPLIQNTDPDVSKLQ